MRGFDRRQLLARWTLGLGAAMGVVLTLPLVRFLFFPIGRSTVSSSGAPTDVGSASAVPADRPTRVVLESQGARDAWSVNRNARVGAAWLVRDAAGEVRAFTCACPHLGCAVDFEPDEGRFACPCHDSAFALDGSRLGGPAKRGLDPLPVRIEDDRVLVTFKRFRADIRRRIEL